MPPSISSTEAGAVYVERHGTPRFHDAWLGWMSAVWSEATRRGFIQVDQAQRKAEGARARKSIGSAPRWLVHGMRVFRPLHHTGRFGPIAHVLTQSDFAEFIDGKIPDSAPFSEEEPAINAFVNKVAASGKVGLRTFYEGVRMVSELRRDEQPAPSQLALLAGACGLETYAQVDPVRVRWEDRARLWREGHYGLALPAFPIAVFDQLATDLARAASLPRRTSPRIRRRARRKRSNEPASRGMNASTSVSGHSLRSIPPHLCGRVAQHERGREVPEDVAEHPCARGSRRARSRRARLTPHAHVPDRDARRLGDALHCRSAHGAGGIK